MRLISILALSLMLVACSHPDQRARVSAVQTETQTEAVMPATYAMSVPVEGQGSNPCAKNFDGIVSNLEMLMAQKNVQTAAR